MAYTKKKTPIKAEEPKMKKVLTPIGLYKKESKPLGLFTKKKTPIKK